MKPNDLKLSEPPQTSRDHERAVRRWFVLKGDLALQDAAEHILWLAEIKERYFELLYAVQNAFPDETRHQTALRYIRERETPATEANAKCSSGGDAT